VSKIADWLMAWRRRRLPATTLPLGVTEQDLEALKALRAHPHWKHYVAVLERVAEAQASELASALPHDRYLFTCGSLTALRRVYTLVDDLLASASKLQEMTDARQRNAADAAARTARTFVNTPWYDGWKRDA
jgi:hypothetical protein